MMPDFEVQLLQKAREMCKFLKRRGKVGGGKLWKCREDDFHAVVVDIFHDGV
jgi:hypothetical protein